MKASDIIDIPGVAQRLGVKVATVRIWRYRKELPNPAGYVSGCPYWETWIIDAWASQTGRKSTPPSIEPLARGSFSEARRPNNCNPIRGAPKMTDDAFDYEEAWIDPDEELANYLDDDAQRLWPVTPR